MRGGREGGRKEEKEGRWRKKVSEFILENSIIKEKNKILKLWNPIIPMHSYDKITLMTPQFDHLK